MMLKRAYYHCAMCTAGFCPRDVTLGLEGTSLSPAVTRMVNQAAATVSFVEGSELMDELAAVYVEAKQVERDGEALGREIAQDERTVVELAPACAPAMYLGMDGTGVPIAKRRDYEGLPVRDPGSVSYSAAIESAATLDTDEELSAFAQRVEREARRRGFDQARRRVVLGDGALWIWNLADELFPGAIQIVDLYHA